MHSKESCAPVVCECARRGSGAVTVTNTAIHHASQKALARRTHQHRPPECADCIELIEQHETLLRGLAETESRIEHDRRLINAFGNGVLSCRGKLTHHPGRNVAAV